MKLRPTVYVETSVISVLVARRSRDPVEAARQTLTRAWWRRRTDIALFTSRVVRDECRLGDPKEAKKRLVLAGTMGDLAISLEAQELATQLLKRGALPAKADVDALHLALAAVHRMEYLVSWNCRHIVNTHILNQAFRVFEPAGYNVPNVFTPDVMLGVLP